MKLAAGLVLSVVAIAGVSAESSETLTIPSGPTPTTDPAQLTGLRPQNLYLNGQQPTTPPSNSDRTRFSPVVQEKPDPEREHDTTNTLTILPGRTPVLTPKQLEGLGPRTPAGDNPRLRKAMEGLGKPPSSASPDELVYIDPHKVNQLDPKTGGAKGLEVYPGKLGNNNGGDLD
ncbi:unnamed protein product [Hyaloperonospora brassicae]|uniref:RxLR effector candidate protein n=1 Tax=Hyaloperonospora brassicae TaxID=162125 RepID=A0AAV0TGM6_HYABA|nr:unnamed protein product [Hyaloperonospora brassicae]